MKAMDTQRRQRGFFDLGFSLLLLGVLGATTGVIVAYHDAASTQEAASCTSETAHSEQPKAGCNQD